MILTDVYTDQISGIYSRFAAEIGHEHWTRRIVLVNREIHGARFLKEFLLSENTVAYQLAAIGEHHAKYKNSGYASIARKYYGAASFAAQVLSIIDKLPPRFADQFRKRVRGAFKNPDDMRGLRLELTVATHFARREATVTWPEFDGTGTHDLHVDGLGPTGLEIECKAISNDKGRKIHRRQALEFYELLLSFLKKFRQEHRHGLAAVLTVPARLPVDYRGRCKLAEQFARQIIAGSSTTLLDGSNIFIAEFEEYLFRNERFYDRRVARRFIDSLTNTANRESMIIRTEAGGIIVLAVQSLLDDNLMKVTFDTLSDAAKRQLPRTNAGIVIAGLDGVDSEGMNSIARQDSDEAQAPTSLRFHASRFLDSGDRDHVVGVGFLSSRSESQERNGIIDTGGSAYYFSKRSSPFWSEDFSGMFRARDS